MSRLLLASFVSVNTCITFYQIKTHFLDIIKIEDDSMHPNLQKDDLVLINKYLQIEHEKRCEKEKLRNKIVTYTD